MTDHDDELTPGQRILEEWAASDSPVADQVGMDVMLGRRAPKSQAQPGDFLVQMAGGLPDHVHLAGNLYPGAPHAYAVIPPPPGSEDDSPQE